MEKFCNIVGIFFVCENSSSEDLWKVHETSIAVKVLELRIFTAMYFLVFSYITQQAQCRGVQTKCIHSLANPSAFKCCTVDQHLSFLSFVVTR